MEPLRIHVYACDQQKPEGVPGCAARGSALTIDALRREIAARGLVNQVQLTACGSLGLCERGPNLVVYPEGIWYSGVTPEDVPEIVESHFLQGRPVARLVNTDASALEDEVRTNRDKYLAGLRARDAAGVMPDDLAQTIRGFQESRVVGGRRRRHGGSGCRRHQRGCASDRDAAQRPHRTRPAEQGR
jgi:(2Fe-2S) ferredoxin